MGEIFMWIWLATMLGFLLGCLTERILRDGSLIMDSDHGWTKIRGEIYVLKPPSSNAQGAE